MNYYNEIKNELLKNEEFKKVKDYSKNRNDLMTYYNVGKLLDDAGKHYGEGIIKKYSERLVYDLDKKYSQRYLRRMRQFYDIFKCNIKWSTVSTILSFSHIQELLILKDINEINYYINISEKENLSVRQLCERIKTNEYNRLSESAKKKLIKNEELSLEESIKDPIIIRSKETDITSENELRLKILEDIEYFMKQLGTSYSFIGTEYKIKLADSYNYIDILLFNIEKELLCSM